MSGDTTVQVHPSFAISAGARFEHEEAFDESGDDGGDRVDQHRDESRHAPQHAGPEDHVAAGAEWGQRVERALPVRGRRADWTMSRPGSACSSTSSGSCA